MAKVKSKKAKREEKKKKYQYSTTQQVMEKRDAGFKPTSFKIPKGWEVKRLDKAGTEEFDVLPFIAGKHNPIADEGIVHWEASHEIHDGIGVDTKAKYVCPAKRGMGRCPVCEHRAALARKGADKDRLKPFNTKKRVLYAIKDHNDEGKFKLFEASYFGQGQGFGEMIDNKLEGMLHKPNHPYHRFWHPTDGRTVQLTTKKAKWPGGTYYKGTNLEFIEREEQLDESVIEEVPCLDDLINAMVLPYDKLKAIFEQAPEAGEGKSKKKAKEEDEEEEDLEADEEEEDLEEDEEGDEDDTGDDESDSESDDDEEGEGDDEADDEDEDESDDEEEEEEEPEEKPKKKVKKPAKKTKKKKEEEEDDDEDSSDDGDDEADDEDSEDDDGDGGEDADDDDEGSGDDDDDSDESSEDDEEEDEESEEVEEDDEGDEDDDIPFSDEDEDEEEEEKPKKKVKKKKK